MLSKFKTNKQIKYLRKKKLNSRTILSLNTPSCDYNSNRTYYKCLECRNDYHISNMGSYYNKLCKNCMHRHRMYFQAGELNRIRIIPLRIYNKEEINYYILICNHINKSFKNILNSNLRIYLKEVYILTLPYIFPYIKKLIIEILNQ